MVNKLPYKKVERFDYKGESYPSEAAAIKAAVEDVLGNTGVGAMVVANACDLAPLLGRYCELTKS